ncbi:YfbM family protein [Streptomyces sp. NPDC047014]|uniref:YfbM family protein n=1 Tax=Streptomyces sp. NPDC047014 TaxID=3155736 RepID=UPI0033D3C52E
MSMIGNYLRLGPAELERALRDPDWAAGHARGLYEREDAAAAARVHETDKAWNALDFVLTRRGFPVDVVFGEEDMPWPAGHDWGYGPPRLLAADRVRAAASALAAHNPDTLTSGVTPADLAAANVYPQAIWERGEDPDWVASHWLSLGHYLRAAAREGDALLIWIS